MIVVARFGGLTWFVLARPGSSSTFASSASPSAFRCSSASRSLARSPFFPTKPPAPAPALPLANGTSISHTNGSSSELAETSTTGGTTHLAPSSGGDTVTYAAQFSPIGLLATTSATRSWPGGVGEFKLAGNYAPCFAPQQKALAKGYQQNLWCLDGRISEAGQMNMFVVLDRGEGKVEVATPRLDGTILPGVTVRPLPAHVGPY